MKNLKNKSGKKYEAEVANFLNKNGWKYKEQQFFGKTLFGKRMRPDFIIEWHEYIITVECKNQVTRGSAEEKIYYTANSIINLHNQFDNVIPFLILSGGGWSTECIKYMKEWEKDNPIYITTVNGLLKELENNLYTWFNDRQHKKRFPPSCMVKSSPEEAIFSY